jgi:hypothetical protein
LWAVLVVAGDAEVSSCLRRWPEAAASRSWQLAGGE